MVCFSVVFIICVFGATEAEFDCIFIEYFGESDGGKYFCMNLMNTFSMFVL